VYHSLELDIDPFAEWLIDGGNAADIGRVFQGILWTFSNR